MDSDYPSFLGELPRAPRAWDEDSHIVKQQLHENAIHIQRSKEVTSPLPDWLSAHADDTAANNTPEELARYPITKEQLEYEELVFSQIFEVVLDRIVVGGKVKDYLQRDPRAPDPGRFMRWVRKDKERLKRYEEAQEISSEFLLEEMDDIAAGTDTIEDIERSKLRLAQHKFKVQAWNKRRYGGEKEAQQPFGNGGIVINIGAVDSPYEKVVNNVVQSLPKVSVDG